MNVDVFGRPVREFTAEEVLQSVKSMAAHDMVTAIAKHRRATDEAVTMLKEALDALTCGEKVYLDVAVHRINYAIKDLLKAKP